MPPVKLPLLLNLFYSTGLRYIPVVESRPERGGEESVPSNGDSGEASLMGFLSRARLDRVMADRERAFREWERLPDDLILREDIPEELISHLSAKEKIPVLNERGDRLTDWEPHELLHAIARFKERSKIIEENPVVKTTDPNKNRGGEEAKKDSTSWLARLVLSEIPFPLFATDLKGGTLFFNSAFEEEIVELPQLKRSIRLAEKYFHEMTQNLLATHIAEGKYIGDSFEPIRSRISELEFNVIVQPLSSEGELVGYLYLFQRPSENILYEETERMREGGLSLDAILDEIESGMIRASLEKTNQNVSHAAEYLRIKRTTLQNKMRRLNVGERFESERAASVIRKSVNRKSRASESAKERGEMITEENLIATAPPEKRKKKAVSADKKTEKEQAKGKKRGEKKSDRKKGSAAKK